MEPKPGPQNLIETINARLDRIDARQNTNLGQHFMIDQEAIDLLGESVTTGNVVIEVGAGVGQLTEVLAQNASQVIAIELDRRYEPILSAVTEAHPNTRVIYGDAVAMDLEALVPDSRRERSTQMVASLPYHIVEPFLHKIRNLPIESATFVVGKHLSDAIQARDPRSVDFGKLSYLVQTFFDADVLAYLDRSKFYPPPRTQSAIIRLTPKEEHEFRSGPDIAVARRLFDTAHQFGPVRNAIKDGLNDYYEGQQAALPKRERNKYNRRSVNIDLKRMIDVYNNPKADTETQGKKAGNQDKRLRVETMDIPQGILTKPFARLDKNEIRALASVLKAANSRGQR